MFSKNKIDRLDFISQAYPKWSNAAGNVTSIPLRVFLPKSKEDVLAIISSAREKGITVRPVGAGHSFSEVAREEYYMIQPFALTQCSIYTSSIRDGVLQEKRHLVKAQAGIRIKCLNNKLYKMKLALDNMGAFDWQTISGALSTGTHGTGLHRPAIQDMVRALIIILSNGDIWQIEPTHGISDPDTFDSTTGIILKQDDDLFYSAILSFGAMGFIYEVILEVGERYWIKETRKVLNWDTELKPAILNGKFKSWVESEYDFVSFRVNPYYTLDKKTGTQVRLCSLALQKAFEGNPPLNQGWGAYSRNVLFTILGNLGISMWILINRLNAKLSRIPGSINAGIRGSKDALFIGRSYEVLYQTGLSIRKQGISSEFAFDLDYPRLVFNIDQLGIHFSALREKYDLYLSSHIPVRFVPKSQAYLSQCHDGPKMYIDLPTLDGVHGATQIIEHNQDFMLNELNGVPHWGKVNHHLYAKPGFIQAKYSKAMVWSLIRAKLDPIGMFYSDFTKRMGL